MKDQSESFKSLNIFVTQSHPGQGHILRNKKIVNNYQLSISNFSVLYVSA